MGIKFLNLQTIPWRLANRIPCLQLPPKDPTPDNAPIKLIKSDGFVNVYHKPIHVSQLMLQFPKHLVCRSDSFYIGHKIPALSEDDQLQLGHNYFLLPKHCFQSALSFVTIASFTSSSSSSAQAQLLPLPSHSQPSSSSVFLLRNAAATCSSSIKPPFEIQKTPSGYLRIRVSDEFISQLPMEQDKMIKSKADDEDSVRKPGRGVCTTPELQKDYTQLVMGSRSRQWKPKLETVRETAEKSKVISSSFGMRRRKKSHDQSNSKRVHKSSSEKPKVVVQYHIDTAASIKPKIQVQGRRHCRYRCKKTIAC